MSQHFLGQIELFAFNFVPTGWAACQGQLLAIQQNQALFAVIGTTYGGDGIRTFGLPDLRGRVAMGQGTGNGLSARVMGEVLGEPNHTILLGEMPTHSHALNVAPGASTTAIPSSSVVLGNAIGKEGGSTFAVTPYATVPPAPSVQMAASAITPTGGSQPHDNMMPYLGLQFCIATTGIFPTRS